MIFQYYSADIKASMPIGELTLQRFISSTRNPSAIIIDVFDRIKQAEINKDMKLKAELKTKLYSFTPCVYINGKRKYSNISHFTGLLVLDFDHLESEEYSREFQQFLFNEYQFIIACWLSPSRHGVKCLVHIPIIKTPDEFKLHFNAIEIEMKQYKGFDSAPKNCVLPLFLSYDPLILYRDDYSCFTKKYIPPEPVKVKQYIVNDKTKSVYSIIKKKIDVIVNNGHPQLRAAAYLLGGYVGAGHIDQSNAEEIIINLIHSNAYLNQKPSVYKQTAKQMIKKGINEPVYLK